MVYYFFDFDEELCSLIAEGLTTSIKGILTLTEDLFFSADSGINLLSLTILFFCLPTNFFLHNFRN